MRSPRQSLLLVAVATLGAVGLSTARASTSASTPRSAHHTTTIHVVQTNAAAFTNIDVGPDGESVGDYVVITGPLVRPGSPKAIGSTSVICTVLKTGATAPLQCTGTTHLAAGDITIQGLLVSKTGRHNRLAVTGGTKSYRTARGEFVATIQDDGSTDGLFLLTR